MVENIVHDFVQNSPLRLMLVSSVIGIGRNVFCLPLEHPFETMKVQWQSNQYLSNELEVLKKITKEKGFMGLYSGYAANFTKHIVK